MKDWEGMMFPKQTKTVHKKYKSSYPKQKQSIKEFFENKCALCGDRGTQIHHIIYRSEDKSKIHDNENMILLCVQCHTKVHTNKKYWQPRLKKLREKY